MNHDEKISLLKQFINELNSTQCSKCGLKIDTYSTNWVWSCTDHKIQIFHSICYDLVRKTWNPSDIVEIFQKTKDVTECFNAWKEVFSPKFKKLRGKK